MEPIEISCEWDRLSFLFDVGFAAPWDLISYNFLPPNPFYCQPAHVR